MIKKSHPCHGCGHRRPASVSCGYGTGSTMCHYLLDTGKRRGCPAGKGCTRYTKEKFRDPSSWQSSGNMARFRKLIEGDKKNEHNQD